MMSLDTCNGRVSFFYHRTNDYNVTIAYTTRYSTSEGLVRFGAAFCNSSDQFSKKVGREIAIDRMTTIIPGDLDAMIGCVPVSQSDPRWLIHEKILATLPLEEYAPENFFGVPLEGHQVPDVSTSLS